MASHVYQVEIGYRNVDDLLASIREAVSDVRQRHPHLKHCALEDVGWLPTSSGVEVTLYFQETSRELVSTTPV